MSHELIVMKEGQRKRGWYLSWRCMRKGCDTRGNLTLSPKSKAWELFELLADAHRREDTEEKP